MRKIILTSVVVTSLSLILGVASKATFNVKNPQIAAISIPESKNEDFDKVVEIKEEISHDRSFEDDDKNFMNGLRLVNGKTKRPYTVFINIHDGSFAQTMSVWTPKVKRTFQWEVPYEQAIRQAMSAEHHSHEQSALLTSWTGGKIRRYISFVIIPQGIEMEFKIGYAAPQASVVKTYANLSTETESRPGGGMQIRLRYVPKGTIILTERFPETKRTYSIPHLFEQAIQNYNKMKSSQKLPLDIVDDNLAFINEDEYVETTINESSRVKN